MNWEAIGAVGKVLGAAAVVGTSLLSIRTVPKCDHCVKFATISLRRNAVAVSRCNPLFCLT